MKRLLQLLALAPVLASGAPGDLRWVNIETNGWVAEVCLAQGNANATFNFGLTTNRQGVVSSENARIWFTLTSMGYDQTGAPTTVQRSLVATKLLRLPYPNQAQKDVQANALTGDVVARCALSEFVYTYDSNVTVTVAANWCGTNTAGTLIAITNNSQLPYPSVVAEWDGNPDNYYTSDFPLSCIAYSAFATHGKQVACVLFTAHDNNNVTHSAVSTAVVKVPGWGRCAPRQHYAVTMPTAGFHDTNTITCDFVAYPWIGNSNSVFATTNFWMFPGQWGSWYGYSITNFYDGSRKYGLPVYAFVDGTSGNDTTAKANTNYATAQASPFLSPSTAMYAVMQTNRNNINGNNYTMANSVIYMQPGTYQYFGTHTYKGWAAVDHCWATVTTAPGVLPAQVVFYCSATASDRSLYCKYQRFVGLSFTNLGNVSGYFQDQDLQTPVELCFTNCYFWSTNSTGPFCYNGGGMGGGHRIFMQNCWFTNCSAAPQPVLMTGTTFLNSSNMSMTYSCLSGNYFFNNTNTVTGSITAGSGPFYPEYGIIDNSQFYGCNSETVALYGVHGMTNGYVIAQSVFECAGTSALRAWGIIPDGNTLTATNFIAYNNTCSVIKCNMFYDESGGQRGQFECWNRAGIYSYFAHKDDLYAGIPACVGAWNVANAVSQRGCYFRSGIPYGQEFSGLDGAFFDPYKWPEGYLNDASTDKNGPTGSGLSGGNYRLTSNGGPQFVHQNDWYLPWDLDGHPRGCMDPPGAYTTASPRRGAAFVGF